MDMPSLLRCGKPPLVAMLYGSTPEEMKQFLARGHAEGCEAFGFGFEYLKQIHRREEVFRELFSLCGDKPFFVTCYRSLESKGLSEDNLAATLLLMSALGAPAVDVPGDLFARPAENGLSEDRESIRKQKALIRELHEEGTTAIMSCHAKHFLPEAEVLHYLEAQDARGADILKLVNRADTEEELQENLQILASLKKQLHKPFLYLAMGDHCMYLRQAGPEWGSCMYLCRTADTGFQPSLRTARLIRDRGKLET